MGSGRGGTSAFPLPSLWGAEGEVEKVDQSALGAGAKSIAGYWGLMGCVRCGRSYRRMEPGTKMDW